MHRSLLEPTLNAFITVLAGKAQAVAADNTFFCNYFGLPAISVPGGFTADGLPIGIRF